MPRIYQNAQKYAVADFQQEIRRQQGHYDLMSVRALAGAMGIPPTTLNPKLKEPHRLTVEEVQKLVTAIQPDIGVMLTLLGYSNQVIKKFKEDKNGSDR